MFEIIVKEIKKKIVEKPNKGRKKNVIKQHEQFVMCMCLVSGSFEMLIVFFGFYVKNYMVFLDVVQYTLYNYTGIHSFRSPKWCLKCLNQTISKNGYVRC